MSEEKVPYQTDRKEPLTEMTEFRMDYSNDERDAMVLTVPLKKIAEDKTINGMIFLLGFFENVKNEAVATIKIKRARLQAEQAGNGKIIVPGQPRMSVH